MIIQHNIPALNSYNKLANNNTNLAKNLEKLSSGYRINRAGDDAAGLAISEKMRAQIKGLETATKNAQDGVSLIQTAEGALEEVHSILNRLVELAGQSANGIYDDDTDRQYIQLEVDELLAEITRISETDFNGIELLDGSLGLNSSATTQGSGTAIAPSTGITALTSKGLTDELATILGGVKVTANKNQTGTNGLKMEQAAKGTWGDAASISFVMVSTTGDDNGGTVTYKLAAGSNATVGDKALLEKFEGVTFTIEHGDLSNPQNQATAVAATGNFTVNADDWGHNAGLRLQIGDKASQTLTVDIADMSAAGLGLNGLELITQDLANAAIDTIREAIDAVNLQRDMLGAKQNRLEHTINNLTATTENITDAEARIRDTDMAKEMMLYTKNSILVQSSQAMLAQANQLPSSVLNLLY